MDFRGELYFIAPITNIPSILENGILSNVLAASMVHRTFAMTDVQERRDAVQIPNGRRLHEYANLYFDARNPTLFKIQEHHDKVCVLVIDPTVLDIPGAVISDSNAAKRFVRFRPANELGELNFDRIYAERWTHANDFRDYINHKAEKCAEALIPERVTPAHILKALVLSQDVANALMAQGFPAEKISVNTHMFFR